MNAFPSGADVSLDPHCSQESPIRCRRHRLSSAMQKLNFGGREGGREGGGGGGASLILKNKICRGEAKQQRNRDGTSA